MSWRSLARLLGVSPYRIREWRRGAAPASVHLFLLLTLSKRLGLQETLMCAEQDTPEAWMEAGTALCRQTTGVQVVDSCSRFALR